jgi:hypothetical protein
MQLGKALLEPDVGLLSGRLSVHHVVGQVSA